MNVCIITGASSGMGREAAYIADKFDDIDEIWLVARRKDRLLEISEKLQKKARIFECDLTKSDDLRKIQFSLEKQKPCVKYFVNGAGFCKFGDIYYVSKNDAVSMIELNISALVKMTYDVLPFMSAGSHIINIASTASFQPLPYMGVYAATKSFVLSFSRSLYVEIRDRGISVTALCPGWTKTEFFDVAKKDANEKAVSNFMFMSKAQNVMKKAFSDAKKGKAISLYGIFNYFHFFFSKLLPASTIMEIWKNTK